MAVPSASFIDTYSAKVTDLMVNMVEYVQALDKIVNTPAHPPSGTGTGTDITILPNANRSIPIHLENNPNGYPILPDQISSEGWKKTAWDSLFTEYIGQQYHLACGGKVKHIPYKRISENQQKFIDPKYLPRKTTFRPPRNIGLKEIKSIFEHLLQRQRDYGPEDTFKFKSIKLKGNSVSAQYKSTEDSSNTINSNSSLGSDFNTDTRPTINSSNSTPGPGLDTASGSVTQIESTIQGNRTGNKERPRPRPKTK